MVIRRTARAVVLATRPALSLVVVLSLLTAGQAQEGKTKDPDTKAGAKKKASPELQKAQAEVTKLHAQMKQLWEQMRATGEKLRKAHAEVAKLGGQDQGEGSYSRQGPEARFGWGGSGRGMWWGPPAAFRFGGRGGLRSSGRWSGSVARPGAAGSPVLERQVERLLREVEQLRREVREMKK